MSPHARVFLFCVALLVAPFLYSIGTHFGGEIVGAASSTAVVAGATIHMYRGQNPRPPTSPKPL